MSEVIQVKVIPKSRTSEVLESMSDGTLKVRVKSAPENGRANEELIYLLAKTYNLGAESFQILSGHTSTRKLVKITRPS